MKKYAVIIFAAICTALFVFTGCARTDEYTEKAYLSDGAEVEEIEIDVFDRELEIYESNDGQIRIEYFDGGKERFEISVSDKKLSVKLTENKEWTDYIGFNKASGEYRKVRISLPSEMIAKLSAATTNGNITITNLSFAESVNLQSNGGSIICDNLGAGKEITLAVKNGDITGSISGAMDEFSITCTIKKGESNLPALKEGGDKSLTAECNNGDINIEFAK